MITTQPGNLILFHPLIQVGFKFIADLCNQMIGRSNKYHDAANIDQVIFLTMYGAKTRRLYKFIFILKMNIF